MLEPDRRRLFLETLRPPEGYDFDRAIGTTFTLDLMTLLSVPLAFTFRDAQDGDGHLATDPIALLEGARRYAGRIAVFCHGGHTTVPQTGQSALAFLEQSVIPVFPNADGGEGRIFHPKVWALRFVSRDEPQKCRYRLVCQSRNLTFDRSWDVSLVLEGELNAERVNAYSVNHPLADFIQALPSLTHVAIPSVHEETITIFADELRRVNFTSPDGLKLERFLPFGIRSRNVVFPDPRYKKRSILVVSPFLGEKFLRRLTASRRGSVLISRREELLKTAPETLRQFDKVYAFKSGLEPEPEDSEIGLPPLAGLHAKMFVIDDGWNARVIVGSGNATAAALSNPPRNIEFMTELVGRKSRFGIDTLLDPSGGESGTFRSLVEEFDTAEAGKVEEDTKERQLSLLIDSVAEGLAGADLKGKVRQSDDGLFVLKLELPELSRLLRRVERVLCWPATLPGHNRRPLQDGQEFTGLSLAQLSSFLAIRVDASIGETSASKQFVRNMEMSGLPEDRLPRLLASMLGDRSRLMRLIWLLLLPGDEMSFDEFSQLITDQAGVAQLRPAFPGLLERMLETLATNPERLDDVESLLKDLRRSKHGAELIGQDFETVWEAVWKARMEDN